MAADFPPTYEVNVGDYANAPALARLLADLEFPVEKNKIIHVVQLKEPLNISLPLGTTLAAYFSIAETDLEQKME